MTLVTFNILLVGFPLSGQNQSNAWSCRNLMLHCKKRHDFRVPLRDSVSPLVGGSGWQLGIDS